MPGFPVGSMVIHFPCFDRATVDTSPFPFVRLRAAVTFKPATPVRHVCFRFLVDWPTILTPVRALMAKAFVDLAAIKHKIACLPGIQVNPETSEYHAFPLLIFEIHLSITAIFLRCRPRA